MDHSTGIDTSVPPSGSGCLECERDGSWWVHLRRCAQCGHVGCCDDSLNRHATAHAAATGHPSMQSFEPGEDWFWSYSGKHLFTGPALAPPTSRPATQTSPGPEDRVPADWRDVLDEARERG